ncbi:6-O-methylguanine DNA methyltransferase [Podospora conica]|nr:6-O-methylguanine DNA methyltransferase [Schizothecium conicum]
MKTTTKTTPTATITFYHPPSPSQTPPPPPSTQLPPPPAPPPTQPSPSPSPKHLLLTSPLSPFHRRALLLLLQIPPGYVTTYATISAFLHSSPRAVGNALRRNPFAPAVPCHRVVAHDRRLGGFKGKVGWRDGEEADTLREKRALLVKEGVKFGRDGRVDEGSVWGDFV